MDDRQPGAGASGAGEVSRQRIREAALQVVAEVGQDEASLTRIARQASLTKSALLHHYATKAELLREVFEEAGHRVLRELVPDETAGAGGCATPSLAGLVLELGEIFRREPELAAMLSRLFATPVSERRELGAESAAHPLNQLLDLIASRARGLVGSEGLRRAVASLILIATALDLTSDRDATIRLLISMITLFDP